MSQKLLCFRNWSSSVCGLALCWCKPWCHCTLFLLWPGAAAFKVTWTHREKTIKEFAVIQGTCLHVSNGKVVLKNTHEYFYQVQTVMAVLNVPYLDFFLCWHLLMSTWNALILTENFGSRHFHDCLVFLETILSPKYSRNVCWNNCSPKKLSWRLLIG